MWFRVPLNPAETFGFGGVAVHEIQFTRYASVPQGRKRKSEAGGNGLNAPPIDPPWMRLSDTASD